LSSRWVLSGVLSPAWRAMLDPFRSGSSLITAAVYWRKAGPLSRMARLALAVADNTPMSG